MRRPNDARRSNFFDFPATFVRIVLRLKEPAMYFSSPFHLQGHRALSSRGGFIKCIPCFTSRSSQSIPGKTSSRPRISDKNSLGVFRVSHTRNNAEHIRRPTTPGSLFAGQKPQYEASEALQC